MKRGGSLDYKVPKKRSYQPEVKDVVTPLTNLMRGKGWYVKKLHGSMFQSGLPDLFTAHLKFGQRLIECKHPSCCKLEFGGLSPSQRASFQELTDYGVQIWILTGPEEYMKLFEPPNWKTYTYVKFSRK